MKLLNRKNKYFSSFSLFLGLIFIAKPAAAITFENLTTQVNNLRQAKTSAAGTICPADATNSNCATCNTKIGEQTDLIERAYAQASSTYGLTNARAGQVAANAGAGAGAAQAANVSRVGDLSLSSSRLTMLQSQAAASLREPANNCANAIRQACNQNASALLEHSQRAMNACEAILSASTLAANERAMSGGNFLDNALKAAQLATMMGQLGMMANQMANQNKGSSGVSGSSAPPQPQKVSLGGGNSGISSNNPGFGANTGASGDAGGKASFKNGAEGFTPFTMPKDFHYEPPKGGTSTAQESGISLPGGPGGGAGGAASAGGGAGAGGTGASSMAEKDKDREAGDVGAFEINSSNGGGRPGFLGLKSKGGEFDELVNNNLAPPTANNLQGDLFGGDRGMASLGAQGATDGINDDGSSLFSVVNAKLKEMKKRGSI